MLLQKRIHDWSEGLPLWQRDLLRRLAAGPLTDADGDEVLAILTRVPGAPAAIPLELSHLPADETEHGCVELRSIGNLRNINCLAEGQTLPLKSGLNVVFGHNSTGKSGYGRLLRGVCRAAERDEVLPNVFEPTKASEPQTAEFLIAVDGTEQPVSVDLALPPERTLSAIAVFDASCAHVYLTKPSVISYVPRALILLKSLAAAQDELAAELRGRVEARRAELPALPEIDPGTAAGAAIVAATTDADVRELETEATLSETELRELEALETAAASIRADKSHELEAAARTRAAGAHAAATALRAAAVSLDPAATSTVADVRARLDSATEAERQLADRAFADQRFPGTGQEPWQDMWQAAKRFVEVAGAAFPSTDAGAACPLCQQELDDAAQSRLAKFEEFVRSDLCDRVVELDQELKQLLRSLPDLVAVEATATSSLRGAPGEVVDAAGAALAVLRAQFERAQRLATGDRDEALANDRLVEIGVVDEYVDAQTALADAQAWLRDADQQREVMTKLAELQARQSLHTALPTIKKRIEGLKTIAGIETAAAELGTQRISNQLRQIQQATVTDRLRKAIRQELEGLSSIAGQVEVVGQASKGETVINLKLRDGCRAKLGSVLSTSEQSALATAFFLAEVAVSEGRSAIVLDDPVSSLDHEHREYLAKRLVEEAKKRQVVIYTHDLTFLYYLQEAAESVGIELHGQTLERSLDEVGIVRDDLPTKVISPSARQKELRRRLRFEVTPLYEGKKPEYEREADLWVADLRKGYDQLIEDYLLAGVVRRWNRHVRVRQLYAVKWSLEITERIDKAMAQASPKSHHEALELYPRAHTPEELRAMLDEFGAICDLTAPKQAPPATADMNEELAAKAQAAGLSQAS